MRLDGEHHVQQDAEVGEHRGDLIAAADARKRALEDGISRDIAILEADHAGVGNDLARQLVDQRGLARAIRPDHRVDLACLDREIYAVGGCQPAEALHKARHVKERHAPSARGLSRGRRASRSTRNPYSPFFAVSTISTIIGPSTIIQCVVHAARISSKMSSATAPATGPMSVPMPPSTTITIRSPEACHAM